MALVKAHRMHGHLAARLDPLGSEPVGDPALEPETLDPPLTPELQARIPPRVLRIAVPGETLAEALPQLRETYCGTIAYEIEHIEPRAARLAPAGDRVVGLPRARSPPEEQALLLRRLAEAEGFERYLRRAFIGQKQFSIEGLDAIVPMLDEALELAAAAGARQVVIGMAHRGRLNVLAHVVGRPYEQILREFEGERVIEAVTRRRRGGDGRRQVPPRRPCASGRPRRRGRGRPRREPEPSRGGRPGRRGARPAPRRPTRETPSGEHDPDSALAILIHGDAAFAGQGVVAETFNLQGLAGYTTGGTLHLIANNQVGFTTDPDEGRSTRYSSDLAKGFDWPIVHVNADDPEAALAAIRLAMAYRERFRDDVVVDLVGYRRFGHNEQDEPAYTQPVMARAIEHHPTVLELYAGRLAREGVIADGEARRSSWRSSTAASRPTRRSGPSSAGAATGSPAGARAPWRARHGGAATDVLARPERAAAGGAGRLHGPPEARPPARAAARDASARTAGSTGARPRRSRSRACSARASRSG